MYGYDVFTLHFLLDAAGLNTLDDTSYATLLHHASTSRYTGLTLYLQIDYSNIEEGTWFTPSTDPTYSYQIRHVDQYDPVRQVRSVKVKRRARVHVMAAPRRLNEEGHLYQGHLLTSSSSDTPQRISLTHLPHPRPHPSHDAR